MVKDDYSEWSKEELIKEIIKLKKRKKYGIVWHETNIKEKIVELCKKRLPVLEEIQENKINNEVNKPTHILIEGDNYHALSVLNYTHKGKIDLIYIDPPYNRGKEGFRYNDKIVDNEDPYKHSKWLSFISKRLILAKNLLKNEGIIYISIDENEFAQLKLLCDDIFNENNFLACITWKQLHTVKNNAKYFSKSTEYILVYGKNIRHIDNIRQPSDKLINYPHNDEDGKGYYKLDPLSARNKNTEYEFYFDRWNLHWKAPKGSYPRYSEDTLKKMYFDNEIVYKEGWKDPKAKRYYERVQEGVPPSTFWDGSEVGFNASATKELASILSRDAFLSPKPTSLIKRCIEIGSKNKNAIVLDFFAGSGTTGHAVLELNKEDDGNRKFILCNNNEENIFTEVCYPRIRNIIQGYQFEGEEYKLLFEEKITLSKIKKLVDMPDIMNGIIEENKSKYVRIEKEFKNNTIAIYGINYTKDFKEGLGGNLKYFRTDFVDAEPTDRNKRKLVDKSTEMLCLKEDCFDEFKNGIDYKIFKNVQDKYLGIIYDDEGIEPFKKEVKELNKHFIVYVFSLDENAREEDFEDIANLVELRPIPSVILNVYRRIFK